MRVPTFLLRETASVEDFEGSGARGPVYGDARSVRCQIHPTTQLVADARGNTVTADAAVIVRPEAGPLRVETRVTVGGVAYRVARCYAMPDSRRPSHWEVVLTRLSAAAGYAGSGS